MASSTRGNRRQERPDNIATNYPFVFTDTFQAPACNPPTPPAKTVNCATNGYNLETRFLECDRCGTEYVLRHACAGWAKPNIKTTYAMDYNMAFQVAITNDIVATISYVGTAGATSARGRKTAIQQRRCCPQERRRHIFPSRRLEGPTNLIYEGISEYNALQAQLEKRLSHGIQFRATYTWSHALDDAADPLGGGIGNYRDANIVPIRQEMTNTDSDTRQRFTFNGYYRLPFGRGESYLSNDSRLVDALFGGWALNLTYQIQDGNPFTVGTANQTNDTGGSQNAIKIGNPFAPGGTPNSTNLSITCPTSVRNKAHWYNPCAYANPLPASAITPFAKDNGNPTVPAPGYLYPTYVTNEAQALLFLGGRSNQIYGPGFQRLDASVFKHFTTFREQFLELRIDAFNVANTPSYGIPSTANDGVNGGQITASRKGQNLTPDARFFQLSAKYVF